MKRIEQLMEHPLFKEYMQFIEAAEADRRFCLHGYEHSLDVARICYIINLENQLGYDKEVIYAMAMLHDIGRAKEYEDGRSHHAAGAEIARVILSDVGFLPSEIKEICEAVSCHKSCENIRDTSLSGILFKADKLSRNCFSCKVYNECYWNEMLKNKCIKY